MDSGASVHATSSMESMVNFKSDDFGKVYSADGEALKVSGKGDVNLKFSSGATWTLKDVRYIPGLKRKLISVGQLDSEGYHVDFGNDRWKVVKGNLVVARGRKRGSLYMVEESCNRGAIGEKDKKVVSNGSISKPEGVKVVFCKEKQKRMTFAKAVRKSQVAKRVAHGDVCGSTPMARVCAVKHEGKKKVVLGGGIPRSSGSIGGGEASTSRRSSRTPRVPHVFLPSANYLLSMVEGDSGQWESEDSGQWKSGALKLGVATTDARRLGLGRVPMCLQD